MTPESIYGPYRECLFSVLARLEEDLENENQRYWREKGDKLFEHLSTRIKTEESMREKCNRRGLPPTPSSALRNIRDSIGVRIVCAFVEDIYRTVRVIRGLEGLRVIEEKDYILHVKENGYRSYHMIVERESEEADCMGNCPGTYFAEIQLRTIAMDSWASLEHKLKYKKEIKNASRIIRELKRCADELASCDLSMQTIRHLIEEGKEEG